MRPEQERPLEEMFLDEMIEGYRDGRHPDCPEPSANRSVSYLHGFLNGRDDRAGSPRAPAEVLRLMADKAIKDDVARASGKTMVPAGAGPTCPAHPRAPVGRR